MKIVIFSFVWILFAAGPSQAYYGAALRGGSLGIGEIRNEGGAVNGLLLNYWWSGNPLQSVNGIALGAAPRTRRMNGIALGLFNSTNDGEINGLGLNLGTAAGKLNGVFVNATLIVANESARGVLIGAWGLEARRVTGFAAGGISGVWIGDLKGMSVGSATVAGSVTGMSVGIVNYSIETRGVQIGALNFSENLNGLQIGILNYAGNNPIPAKYLPVLNLHLSF